MVGNTIGAGILRAPGSIASYLPEFWPYMALWIAGALYALLGANALAELGTMVPRSGGQYVFVRQALGDYAGFVVGWSDWISTCGTTALVAILFGEYTVGLFPELRTQTVVALMMLADRHRPAVVRHPRRRRSADGDEHSQSRRAAHPHRRLLHPRLPESAPHLDGRGARDAADARRGPLAAGGDLHVRRLDRAHLLQRRDPRPRPQRAARDVRRPADGHRHLSPHQRRVRARRAAADAGRARTWPRRASPSISSECRETRCSARSWWSRSSAR